MQNPIFKATALVLALALAACGSGNENTDSSTNELNENGGSESANGDTTSPNATPVEGQTNEGVGEVMAPKPDQTQLAQKE